MVILVVLFCLSILFFVKKFDIQPIFAHKAACPLTFQSPKGKKGSAKLAMIQRIRPALGTYQLAR